MCMYAVWPGRDTEFAFNSHKTAEEPVTANFYNPFPIVSVPLTNLCVRRP